MTVTTNVHSDGDTVTGRFTLKNLPTVSLDEVRKPAYAYAGLADLALEQARELPSLYVAELKKVQARLADAPTTVKTLPAQVKELRGDVRSRLVKVQDSAERTYTSLARRGERLVGSIRRQSATEDAIAEGKQAVKKAEASASAAKKAASDAASKLG